MFNSKKLAQVLMKISQSQDSEKGVQSFFKYLDQKNLKSLLPQIKKNIKILMMEDKLDNTLIITTKHNLTEAETKEIISLVGADENVQVEIIKDESIVGGFSATYQGNIYDGSLRNQITQLKTALKS